MTDEPYKSKRFVNLSEVEEYQAGVRIERASWTPQGEILIVSGNPLRIHGLNGAVLGIEFPDK